MSEPTQDRTTEEVPEEVAVPGEDQLAFDVADFPGGIPAALEAVLMVVDEPDEYAPVVERFVLDGQQARITQASLETLAVIAYRQPVSRSRVAAVRGVNVDGVIRTLLTRGLIEEVGQDEESTAILYGTTSYFLERLGLQSLDDLPALAPYLPEVDVLDEIAEGGRS
ncbi:MAG: scpB [Ornithinibacter sp.]|nr:scpB [Ornithinibacter sp.]